MKFVKSESDKLPELVEYTKDGKVYVRKNIVTEERQGYDEQSKTMYVYDEALITTAEYAAYSAIEEVEVKREAEIVDEYTLALIEEGVL